MITKRFFYLSETVNNVEILIKFGNHKLFDIIKTQNN